MAVNDQAIAAGRAADRSGRELFLLFFGVLGPPTIWAARFAASYVLVPYVCWWGWLPVMHVVTVAALAGTAIAGWVAGKRWRRSGGGGSGDPESGAVRSRTRFLGGFGLLSAALFFVVMVAEWLPNFLMDPCQMAGAPLA